MEPHTLCLQNITLSDECLSFIDKITSKDHESLLFYMKYMTYIIIVEHKSHQEAAASTSYEC